MIPNSPGNFNKVSPESTAPFTSFYYQNNN
jgi:hypothetical protein